MSKLIKSLIALGTLIGMIFSVYLYLDGHYAKAEDLQMTNQSVRLTNARLEHKIINDEIKAIQQRIWQLKDRYDKTKDDAIKLEIRELEQERQELIDKLNKRKEIQ